VETLSEQTEWNIRPKSATSSITREDKKMNQAIAKTKNNRTKNRIKDGERK
jgi:hypothetical protein